MYNNLKRFLTIAAASIILSSLTPLPYSSLMRDAEAARTINITTDTTWSFGSSINSDDIVNVFSGATLTIPTGFLTNFGTININSGGRILLTGGLSHAGILNINGGILVASGVFVTDKVATINVNSGGVFQVSSTQAVSYGHIFVNDGGTLNIFGQLENNGHFRVGILDVNSGGLLNVGEGGEIRNVGT